RLWHLAEQLVIRASEGDSKTMRFASRASHFNQSLMELGALICTPRRPKCGICPVARNCVARRQGRTDRYPNLGRRVASIPRRVVAFVLRRGNRYLVRQRPAGVVNAHLWEFPNVEWTGPKLNLRAAARRTLGFEPKRLRPLCTVRHSITRYRIQLQVYTTKVDLLVRPAQAKGSWLTLPEMQNLSFPSAHKKVLLQMTGVVAARRQ
ncbi:MAG: NUDIX domain-containing protein, partial [Verrucomicrobiota bacterium]